MVVILYYTKKKSQFKLLYVFNNVHLLVYGRQQYNIHITLHNII